MKDATGEKHLGAVLFGVAASAAWAIGPVLSRSVRGYFEVSFQNLVRFTVSLVIMWGFTFFRLGARGVSSGFKKTPQLFLKCLAPAVGMFFFQYLYMAGIYRLYTTVAALISNVNVIFSVILAFLFFHEERSIIRSGKFLLGLSLALAGMAVIIMTGGEREDFIINVGILFIILAALSWTVHSVFIKKSLSDVPVTLATAIIFTINALLFLAVNLIRGDIPAAGPIPLRAWLVLAASGFISIGLGNTFFFASVPRLGVTVANSLALLIPLFTVLFSWLVLDELLLPVQAAAGVILLAGCYLIIRRRAAGLQ